MSKNQEKALKRSNHRAEHRFAAGNEVMLFGQERQSKIRAKLERSAGKLERARARRKLQELDLFEELRGLTPIEVREYERLKGLLEG